MTRILIIGGYGAFGAHIAERLSRERDLDLVIAGRNGASAQAEADRLRIFAKARIGHAVIDATTATAADLGAMKARIVINASGPFQAQNYGLARAAIAAGCHYVDLADARGFVTGITVLDGEARAASVLIVSGASSVPGLSSAVVRHYAEDFAQLDRVDIGISPGNGFDPGEATAISVLGAVGRPFAIRLDGQPSTVYGWQGLHRHHFPGIGGRWMSSVEVPDLDLICDHYPDVKTVQFSAGLEVGLFHLGLWGMSWLVRAGLINHLAGMTRPLLRIKRRLAFLGSDRGGMFVKLEGADMRGARRCVTWHLIAGSGHGPYVPTIASVILAKRLARGDLRLVGAVPCFGLFTLDEFLAEVGDLDIRCWID